MKGSHPRFLASELPFRPAGECRFQVIPVPYEATVSYGGGTAKGPAAILEASNQLEVWTGRSVPSEQGIFTWPAVDCSGPAEAVLERIEAVVSRAMSEGPQDPLPKLPAMADPYSSGSLAPEPPGSPARPGGELPCLGAPVMPIVLGGEHTVTLGVLRALKKRYGPFGIIQFDAHADLRDSYEGSMFSHACVMRRAVEDLGLPLFQVGVRSLCPDEAAYRKIHRVPRLDARELGFLQAFSPSGSGAVGTLLPIPGDFPDRVFLTFDIDALDASLMPATGTPEPGGLFWWDALTLVERCLAGRVCLGFDVVELAPVEGLHAPNYTAARLVHEIMGIAGGRESP